MNIFITGGAGYLGTELVELLAQKPDVKNITVYDNLSRGNYNLFLGPGRLNGKLKLINGDVLDSRQLRKVLQGVDVIYHLAAKVTTPYANTDPHYFEQVNHWGSAEVVSAAEERKVNKFIFVSSTSVYGNSDNPVNEKSDNNPVSYYGVSKSRAEEQVRRLFAKSSTYIYRCANVYGFSRSMRFDSVINKFMFEAHFSNRITIQGSGNQARPFIHVRRVVQQLADALHDNKPSGVYNLAERNLSVAEIASGLREIYPGLDNLYVNPHIISPSLRLELPDNNTAPDFSADLAEFKNQFSFYAGQ
jgi:UDP-glucose 4-epimerase